MSKIYTKTGDKGSTSLLGGTRVSKAHARIESYGSIDELNAHLGYLIEISEGIDCVNLLENVQEELFVIGSHLANESADMLKHLPEFKQELIHDIENQIDAYTAALEPLRHFIMPRGSQLVAYTHICRTVCRRTERTLIRLNENERIESHMIVFLNRLSDFFFVLGRAVAQQQNVTEVIWKGK